MLLTQTLTKLSLNDPQSTTSIQAKANEIKQQLNNNTDDDDNILFKLTQSSTGRCILKAIIVKEWRNIPNQAKKKFRQQLLATLLSTESSSLQVTTLCQCLHLLIKQDPSLVLSEETVHQLEQYYNQSIQGWNTEASVPS